MSYGRPSSWNSSRCMSLQPAFFHWRFRRGPGLAPIIEFSVPRSGRSGFAHYLEQLGGGAYATYDEYLPSPPNGSRLSNDSPSSFHPPAVSRKRTFGSHSSDTTYWTATRYHLLPVSLRDPRLSPRLSLSLSRSSRPCLSRSSYLDERCPSVTLRFTKPRMVLLRYSPGTKVDCYGVPYIPEGQCAMSKMNSSTRKSSCTYSRITPKSDRPTLSQSQSRILCPNEDGASNKPLMESGLTYCVQYVSLRLV